MHACVIGSGIIGVTTAWALAQRGMAVTLADAASAPAEITSRANGGQLSYSYVAPLAAPSVLPHLPHWLLDRTSPLRFRPRFDPNQWRWALTFLRACNRHTMQATTAALLALAYASRDELHALEGALPLDFDHEHTGKLVVYRHREALDKAAAQVAYQATLGSEQVVLDAAGCVAREPALADVGDRLAGGIFTPGEESGDCRKLAQALFAALQAMPDVTIRMGTTVRRLRHRNGTVTGLETAAGEVISADRYIVAAGMGSNRLLHDLGIRPALCALKGYSLTVPAGDAVIPTVSVTDYERKTVYANLGGRLRIAAMVGIGMRGIDVIEADRIALLKRQVREVLPNVDVAAAAPWAGERPATATGLPIIGRTRAATNVWVNIGQGSLGFTLACGSARLLGDLLVGSKPAIDPAPFRPDF